MGGGLSLWLASTKPQVGACVVYYGVLQQGAQPDYANLKGPVLGHFAENDAFASPAAVKDMEEKIKAGGQSAEFYTYPGTEHGFFNDTRAEVHKSGPAAETWERTLAFFRKHLG
jgi:carboxymethylenebutenolidase